VHVCVTRLYRMPAACLVVDLIQLQRNSVYDQKTNLLTADTFCRSANCMRISRESWTTRNVYWSRKYVRLFVCLTVCSLPHAHTTARIRM